MPLFISSSQTCGLRENNQGNFVFHNPSTPNDQAIGTWQDVVDLSLKILVREARVNGGVIGTILEAANAYADGVDNGKVHEQSEEFSGNLREMVSQLKERNRIDRL